jgi:hypothetical protein
MQIFKSLGIGLSLLLIPVCASAADGEQRSGLQMVSTGVRAPLSRGAI